MFALMFYHMCRVITNQETRLILVFKCHLHVDVTVNYTDL